MHLVGVSIVSKQKDNHGVVSKSRADRRSIYTNSCADLPFTIRSCDCFLLKLALLCLALSFLSNFLEQEGQTLDAVLVLVVFGFGAMISY